MGMHAFKQVHISWSPVFLICFITIPLLCRAYEGIVFDPQVYVKNCTNTELVITVKGASQNGIVYIQDQGNACQFDTKLTLTDYAFEYRSCGIKWNTEVRVVVQKKASYQTGHDKVIPVTCIADMSNIIVTADAAIKNLGSGSGVNRTVRPSARMRVLRDDQDVSGGDVILSDNLRLQIELDAPFLDAYDISPESCDAATIKIINDKCATDPELFPNFDRSARGQLGAEFGAFRPTDVYGRMIAMAISCKLVVCDGDCSDVECPAMDSINFNTDQVASMRKKRAIQTRVTENVFVGTTIRILDKPLHPPERSPVCMDPLIFIPLVAAALLVIAVPTIINCRNLRDKTRRVKMEEVAADDDSRDGNTDDPGEMSTQYTRMPGHPVRLKSIAALDLGDALQPNWSFKGKGKRSH